MIVHMNVHKNKKMLGTILKDPEHSITFKSTCERPEIQDVNVLNVLISYLINSMTIYLLIQLVYLFYLLIFVRGHFLWYTGGILIHFNKINTSSINTI